MYFVSVLIYTHSKMCVYIIMIFNCIALYTQSFQEYFFFFKVKKKPLSCMASPSCNVSVVKIFFYSMLTEKLNYNG